MEEKKITNPVKAIRAKCLDCCCGSSNEVELHLYRLRPLSVSQREEPLPGEARTERGRKSPPF